MPPKKIEQRLAELTREFFARNPGIKLVAVTGSAGKTSTKIAIATILSQQYTLQLREEAPETKADVFLQIMGVTLPDDNSRSKWKRVIEAVEQRVNNPHPEVQVIVQEFNPKAPGDNEWFKQYLLPDITVVSAVTDGRMQVEHSVEEVAGEMIALANNSKTAMVNRDDVEGRFASFLINPFVTTYGMDQIAEYYFDKHHFEIGVGNHGKIISPENPDGLPIVVNKLGDHNIRPAVVAAAVGYKMGVTEQNITVGISKLHSVAGRMNVLKGGKGSWLIDDSYSSSPATALAALQTLYSLEAPQRIAVFGNMNGLRGVHEQAHRQLGGYCNIEMLDWVVTVGGRANLFLAPEARKNGCQVKECVDAIEAGTFVREKLQEGGIALFKGSSGGVWLEEAVKLNLLLASDSAQLVRQEPEWLEKKQAFFTANRSGDGDTINKLGIGEMVDQGDDSYPQVAAISPAQPSATQSHAQAVQPAARTPVKRIDSNTKSIVKKVIFGTVALALLVAAVLVYFLWWQSPQKMITDAMFGLVQSEKTIVNGKISLKLSENNNIDAEVVFNRSGGRSSVDAAIVVKADSLSQDVKIDLDTVTDTDGAVYFKLGKIDELADLYVKDLSEDYQSLLEDTHGSTDDIPESAMDDFDKSIRTVFEPIVEQVNDQWIKLTKDGVEGESQEATCTMEVFEKFQSDASLQKEIAQIYRDNQFLVVKNKIESRNGGTGFEVDLSDPTAKARMKSFSQAVESSQLAKLAKECDESAQDDAPSDSSDETQEDIKIKLWVHPFTHQLTALELSAKDNKDGMEVVMSGDFQVGKGADVDVPGDSRDIKELFEDISELMNGQVEGLGGDTVSQDDYMLNDESITVQFN